MTEKREEAIVWSDGIITTREQKITAIQKFTLFSDTFTRVVFEDIAACQYVFQILTGDRELQLRWAKTQYVLSRLASHDAWLDVLAKSVSGTIYAMEIQNRDDVDHPHRARFYESMIDSHFLEKGRTYDALPDVTLIYVCKGDFLESGAVAWNVEKYQGAKAASAEGTDAPESNSGSKQIGFVKGNRYEDGLRIQYVNAEIDDGSEIARLMQYFLTADPEDMSHRALSERVRILKHTEKGRDHMCEVTDLFWRSGYVVGEEKGEKRGIRLTKQALMFQAQGKTQQEIAKELKLSQKEVALMVE